MLRLFAVMQARGASWNDAVPLERQADWPAHAAFMNALEAEGFVLLGGLLEDTGDALLILRARDADEVRWRLAADPWAKAELLRLTSVLPWTLRLGEDFEANWVGARARAKANKRQDRARQKPTKAKVAAGRKPRKAKVAAARKPSEANKSQ